MKKLPHEDGQKVNEEAIRWAENSEEPFFLWLHYMDVHMPYIPPNKFLDELGLKRYSYAKKVWLGKKIDDIKMRDEIKDNEVEDYINLYDGSIRYADFVLKELITELEDKYPKTIFIITADHGEEFREHGGLSHLEKLYDELIHIPLMFYGKDVKHKIIEKPVSLVDLVPTILDFLDMGENEWPQGESIFRSSKDFVIAEAWKNERVTAYRDKEWKLIIGGGKKELYNLVEDKKEEYNLYNNERYSEKVKEFEKIINGHIKMLEEERRKRKTWFQKEKIRKAMEKMKIQKS